MKKLYFMIIMVSLLSTLTSCTKSTDTTDTKLSYSFSAINLNASLSSDPAASGAVVNAGVNGSISWTVATINISKIEFSAKKSAASVSFESKNLYALNALKPDSLSGAFFLSSGVYENNEFKISMEESSSRPALILSGTYTEVSGTKIPFIVQFNISQLIKLEVARIQIEEGNYVAKVSLELNGLVKGLTASDFGQTTRSVPNNTILVTNTVNKALFDKLISRLPSTLSVSVKKQ